MSGRPNKTVLADMLKQETEVPYATYYNSGTFKDSMSIAEQAQANQDEIYSTLASPLKKVQQAYLRETVKTCYPEKHMAPDFTNAEQIKLCHARLHDQHFGPFKTHLENVRNSTMFRYQDCEIAAGNSVEKTVVCLNKLISQSLTDNAAIASRFAADYAQYM